MKRALHREGHARHEARTRGLGSGCAQRVRVTREVIVGILKAIRELMHTPVPQKRPIGFTANLDEQYETR